MVPSSRKRVLLCVLLKKVSTFHKVVWFFGKKLPNFGKLVGFFIFLSGLVKGGKREKNLVCKTQTLYGLASLPNWDKQCLAWLHIQIDTLTHSVVEDRTSSIYYRHFKIGTHCSLQTHRASIGHCEQVTTMPEPFIYFWINNSKITLCLFWHIFIFISCIIFS